MRANLNLKFRKCFLKRFWSYNTSRSQGLVTTAMKVMNSKYIISRLTSNNSRVDWNFLETKLWERITDEPWSLAIYPATNMFIWTRIVYKGRFKKCNLIQSAKNDVTKRANLSKIGTFKPFINLVQTC